MTSLTRKDWVLLVLLTLCWGINWSVMKIGVHGFPPITFRTLSMLGSLPVIWLAARMQGTSLAIRPAQIKTVVRLMIPNMLMLHLFTILAISMLSSGRAAILGYTMPVWAVMFGLVVFGERVTRAAWIGIGCALAGAMLLLSSEFANLAGHPLGSLLALVAAAGWGYGTVIMKRSRIEMPTISLTFWMIALAALIMAGISILFEHAAWRMPTLPQWGAIIYNALIILAFAHVVWFKLARMLPPVASGLSVMMIPVLAVFAGSWLLDEIPHWQDYAAMVLILAAMSIVLLKPRTTAPT